MKQPLQQQSHSKLHNEIIRTKWQQKMMHFVASDLFLDDSIGTHDMSYLLCADLLHKSRIERPTFRHGSKYISRSNAFPLNFRQDASRTRRKRHNVNFQFVPHIKLGSISNICTDRPHYCSMQTDASNADVLKKHVHDVILKHRPRLTDKQHVWY